MIDFTSNGLQPQSEEITVRRLAAILVADVVGYSHLMEEDEAGTLAAFRAHRSELIDPTVIANSGRIVKSTGDGVLVEFGSVVDATACAVQIQQGMAKRNANIADSQRLVFRMGINIGDIIIEDEDIQGDGVNVAARLEQLAEPGGICVSRSARNQIRGKMPYSFEDLGDKKVKNITRPVHVFRVVIDGQEGKPVKTAKTRPIAISRPVLSSIVLLLFATLGAVAWLKPWAPQAELASVENAAVSVPAKPSIAVLPFANLSDDPEQKHFSDGITQDVITDLSKFSGLFVIAANSTFRYKGKSVKPQDLAKDLGVRYVLEGSVQRVRQRLRINAQLIDASTGHHIWADRYDRQATDLFAVQNEISTKIVEVIAPVADAHGKLLRVELDRLAKKPAHSLEAYDHLLKGVVHYDKYSKEDNLAARREFSKAIELDPQYAKAMAKKAWTYIQAHWNGWEDAAGNPLGLAQKSAQDAIKADPNEPEAHRALGGVRLFLRQHDLAIASYQKAVELNPNGADLMMESGWALTYAGLPDEALKIMDEALSRNPYYPGSYLWDIAWGHFVAHRYGEAVKALEKRHPKTVFTHLLLAVNYAKVGRIQHSLESMKRFRAEEPTYSIETVAATEPFKNKADLEHWLDALRAVGLPEKPPKQ